MGEGGNDDVRFSLLIDGLYHHYTVTTQGEGMTPSRPHPFTLRSRGRCCVAQPGPHLLMQLPLFIIHRLYAGEIRQIPLNTVRRRDGAVMVSPV